MLYIIDWFIDYTTSNYFFDCSFNKFSTASQKWLWDEKNVERSVFFVFLEVIFSVHEKNTIVFSVDFYVPTYSEYRKCKI